MAFLVATTSLPAVYRPNGYARTTTAGTPHVHANWSSEFFRKHPKVFCLNISNQIMLSGQSMKFHKDITKHLFVHTKHIIYFTAFQKIIKNKNIRSFILSLQFLLKLFHNQVVPKLSTLQRVLKLILINTSIFLIGKQNNISGTRLVLPICGWENSWFWFHIEYF